jgi:HAMP domain-containing protein
MFVGVALMFVAVLVWLMSGVQTYNVEAIEKGFKEIAALHEWIQWR